VDSDTKRMNDFEAWQKILDKWKQVNKMQDINQRLYDELGGSLMYILEYSEKNNIVLPNRDRLYRIIDNIHQTMDDLNDFRNRINSIPPTKNEQQNKTTEDGTEPRIVYSLK
jgi:hypothetical protein